MITASAGDSGSPGGLGATAGHCRGGAPEFSLFVLDFVSEEDAYVYPISVSSLWLSWSSVLFPVGLGAGHTGLVSRIRCVTLEINVSNGSRKGLVQ